MFSLIKNKLVLIGGAIIAGLLVVVRVLFASRAKQKKRADQAEAELEFKEDVEELDNELESNYQPHRSEIVNADDDETFDVLGDPGSVRMRD